MRKEHQTANSDKSKNGNKYEKELYLKIKKDENLKIRAVNRQKKFYYKQKTPAEEIAESIKSTMKSGTYSERKIKKAIDAYIAENGEKPFRDEKRYYKRADITFTTEGKYFINGKLKNIRIIIDTTTSARGDRLKAKAQDAEVYTSLGINSIYLIVLPNDDYFAENDYAKPNNEINACKKAIYDNNFCNLYAEENVSLILQEKDLFNFLNYISKREVKDFNKLIALWKKFYYKDLYAKRKIDETELKEQLKNDVIALLKK